MELLDIFQSVKTGVGWKNASLCNRLILYPAWLGKLGVSLNFSQFLGVICAENLSESGILCFSWGASKIAQFV